MDEGMNKELRSNKTKLLYTYPCPYFIILDANISGYSSKRLSCKPLTYTTKFYREQRSPNLNSSKHFAVLFSLYSKDPVISVVVIINKLDRIETVEVLLEAGCCRLWLKFPDGLFHNLSYTHQLLASLPQEVHCTHEQSNDTQGGVPSFRLLMHPTRMFTGFWVIGFDFFQSDPNMNSDTISFNRTR